MSPVVKKPRATRKKKVVVDMDVKNVKGQKELRKHVGTYLRMRRNAAQISQLDLANLCGIHRQYVSRWERGEMLPSPRILTMLSHSIHLNTNTFVDALKDMEKIVLKEKIRPRTMAQKAKELQQEWT